MTNIEEVERIQKEDEAWFLKGHLIDFMTLNNAYPEVFSCIKLEYFEGYKELYLGTREKDYCYENFKYRNYENITLDNNAKLSVFFDSEKETVEAILTTNTGIYKFLFEIKIENMYKEA